jgi:hypothetical protein
MPLRPSAAAPPDAHQILTSHLQELFHRAPVPKALAGLSAPALSATHGYQVYSVNLEDLSAGRLLDAARPQSWRYLLLEQGAAVAEADLQTDATGVSRVVAVHRGPSAGGTAQALSAIVATPALAQGDYEPRLLEIPGVHFVGLWLAGQAGNYIVPIAPDRSSLPRNQVLKEEEALPVLRQRAIEVLAQQRDKPGPSGG